MKIHPLADETAKNIKIKFIHSDKKEHFFYSIVNEMTGDRLTGFDSEPPTLNQEKKEIKRIIDNLKKKCKVLEIIGEY